MFRECARKEGPATESSRLCFCIHNSALDDMHLGGSFSTDIAELSRLTELYDSVAFVVWNGN